MDYTVDEASVNSQFNVNSIGLWGRKYFER